MREREGNTKNEIARSNLARHLISSFKLDVDDDSSSDPDSDDFSADEDDALFLYYVE